MRRPARRDPSIGLRFAGAGRGWIGSIPRRTLPAAGIGLPGAPVSLEVPLRAIHHTFLGMLLGLSLDATASDSKGRIVSAASVSLREDPGTTRRELARVALGTLLEELARTGGVETIGGATAPWLRVSTPAGEEGWIFGAFTLPYSEAERDALALAIAEERMKRKGDGFEAFAELRAFLVRAAQSAVTPESGARLELAGLRALDRTTEAIGYRRLRDPRVLAWLEANARDVVYSEPGGRWLVVADRYWELHERSATFPVAEEIAWTAARAYLPGECEGFLPCSLGNLVGTDGRYLELHPLGAHAGEALSNIALFLDGVAEDPHGQYSRENLPAEDRPQLRKDLERLERVLVPVSDARARAAASSAKVLHARYR